MKDEQTYSPVLALNRISQEYPGIWKHVEVFHKLAHKDGPTSVPKWCYLPVSAAGAAIVSSNPNSHKDQEEAVFEALEMACIVAAIGTWRMTKGVYRFDPEVLEALKTSTIDCAILSGEFMTLPEWCCYCETPGFEWLSGPMLGFWCHLEWDPRREQVELRLLIDTDEELVPAMVPLGPWTVVEGVERAFKETYAYASLLPEAVWDHLISEQAEKLHALVSIVLYLCTQAGEIRSHKSDELRPCNPTPQKVKSGLRIFPADGVREWSVGVRIGAKLRAAWARSVQSGSSSGRVVRAHFRRGHYHNVLSGPRLNEFGERIPSEKRTSNVRWRYPTFVNFDNRDGNLPATIRAVD